MRQVLFLSFLLIGLHSFSQVKKGSHYLFPGFEKAVVTLKSGQTENIDLNYNTLTEEMVFVKNGRFLAIANLKDVETVAINGRTFIPFNGAFLEKVYEGKTAATTN